MAVGKREGSYGYVAVGRVTVVLSMTVGERGVNNYACMTVGTRGSFFFFAVYMVPSGTWYYINTLR